MWIQHYNHFGSLIILLSLGSIYFILKYFQIENYDWIYAIPIGLLFLYSLFNKDLKSFPFNTENDENSKNDKP